MDCPRVITSCIYIFDDLGHTTLSSTTWMPSARLSNLPVELFERVLEYLDIFDIVRLKLVRASPFIKWLS